MKIHLLELSCNTYIIETDNKNAVLIDIGEKPEAIIDFLMAKGLTLKKILLTHGHFDHSEGVENLRLKTGAEVFVHSLEIPKLENENDCRCGYYFPKPFLPVAEYTIIKAGDIITQDELSFKVMHTPGHTAGGVCYICGDVIFSGDTLFRCSMGRTDFADGNESDILLSLKKLSELDGNYTVYPGHDRHTTLEYERQNNPYMMHRRFY